MAADRAHHIAELVSPSLQAGRHVVSDRSVYSSLAYQGYGRQQDIAELKRINDWAIGGLWVFNQLVHAASGPGSVNLEASARSLLPVSVRV